MGSVSVNSPHSSDSPLKALLVLCGVTRTEVWVALQVSLHGVDEVPAGQEDEHGAGHLQRLDVLQKRLHQLEGRFLLIDLRHRMLRLRRILRPADHITVSLGRNVLQSHVILTFVTVQKNFKNVSHVVVSSLLVFVFLLSVHRWRHKLCHLDGVLQEIL